MALETPVTAKQAKAAGVPDRRGRASRIARRALPIVAIAVAALAGPLVVLFNSRNGIHVTPDSFTYLGTASNLARGRGWTYPYLQPGAPVTLFPPLFPLLLALGDLMQMDVLRWTLWQSAVLYWGLLLLSGLGVYFNTGRSLPAALAGVAFGVLGLPTLLVYSNVWSETLFLPLELLGLFLLASYLHGGRTRDLLLAAAATSLALATRYMGLSLFLTAMLLLAVWPGRRILERVRVLGIYGGISVALGVLWAVRNVVESSTLTGNNHLVHSLTRADLVEGLKVVYAWFFVKGHVGPWGLSIVVLVALAVLFGYTVAVALARGRWGSVTVPAAAVVLLTFAVMHFLFIMAANAFSTRAPPFNDRMLGPIYLALALGTLILGHALWVASTGRRAPLRLVLAVGLVALLIVTGVGAHTFVPTQEGAYRKSAAALTVISKFLRPAVASQPGAVIYATAPNVVWFATGRPVYVLPQACNPHQSGTPDYRDQMRALARKLNGRPRVVVVLSRSDVGGFASRACKRFSSSYLQSVLQLTPEAKARGVTVLVASASKRGGSRGPSSCRPAGRFGRVGRLLDDTAHGG